MKLQTRRIYRVDADGGSTARSRTSLPRTLLGAGTLAMALAGCGGGGGTPATQSLSGLVIDGPLQGATVCLDVNGNGRCDSDEPTSGPTNAQGNYTITGLTSDQMNSGAAFVAVVPATAIDASNPGKPVGTAFTLSAPAGNGAVISPISTMVQIAVASGMTLSSAESAVANQLMVSPSSVLTNYASGSPTGDAAVLALTARMVVAGLQAGTQPTIAVASASPHPSYRVRTFSYADAADYYVRYYYSDNVLTMSGPETFFDRRAGLSSGAAMTTTQLYGDTLFLSRTGWVQVEGTTPNATSNGSPYASSWGPYTYIGTQSVTDVSGQPIASVVSAAQSLTANSSSTLIGVPNGLPGTMPQGATVHVQISTSTYAPVYYHGTANLNNSVTLNYPAVTTVAQVVAAFPLPSSPAAGNTIGMGRLQPSYTCPGNAGSCVVAQQLLRVAFGAGDSASYYLCDLSWPSGTIAKPNNCAAAGTGSYNVGVGIDGATPILTFTGLPAQADSMSSTRVFIETGGQVWYGWQDKLGTGTATELNDVAFGALAAALGISAPPVSGP